MSAKTPGAMHGVTGAELGKIPAILYLFAGRDEDRFASVNFFGKVYRDNALADGMPSCHENYLGGKGAMLHETCAVNDHMWSFGYMLMATGDAKYGDLIEKIYWNAARACVTPDFRALQYFSGPNQAFATERSSSDFAEGKDDGHIIRSRIAYRPGSDTECCAGNVHRLNPTYVSRMWMSDRDGMPVAVLYGESDYEANLKGRAVRIEERTGYPFDGMVLFRFHMDAQMEMSFGFRVPGWASDVRVTVNGNVQNGKYSPGTFGRVRRCFSDGDEVVIDIPIATRQEWFPGGISFLRGPVLYGYPIPCIEQKTFNGFKCTSRCPAYEYRPSGPWNYGVMLYEPARVHEFVETEGEGRDLAVLVRAHRISDWKCSTERSEVTPNIPERDEPFSIEGEGELLKLKPMCDTRLRISVFPEVVGK